MTNEQPPSRADMLQVISDLSKDAYGYRVRLDYAAMSDTELQSTWNQFLSALKDTMQQEAAASAQAKKTWGAHIQGLMNTHSIDQSTAIRWDMQAMDAYNGDRLDPGYYCYLTDLPYEMEPFFKEASV